MTSDPRNGGLAAPDPIDIWWPGEPAATFLRQRGNLVPVVGAGFSNLAGLPLAGELGEWLADTFPTHNGDPIAENRRRDCSHVASRISGSGDGDRERSLDLRKKVAEYYALGNWNAIPSLAARSLVRVPSRMIVTFNYDRLLEEAADEERVACTAVTWRELDKAIQRLTQEEPPSELMIVHIHGSVDDPESIVLDGIGYSELTRSLDVGEFWTLLCRIRRLLLLGVSLDEAYVVQTLERVRGGQQGHVFIEDVATGKALDEGRLSLDFDRAPPPEAVQLKRGRLHAPSFRSLPGGRSAR